MIGRVAGTIGGWGRDGGYFATDEDADAFEAELTYILLHQIAAFNSPVWFNVGFEEHPQCSACFILSVEDTIESILELEHQGGHDLPRRLRLGHQPLEHPQLEGAPVEGRPRERPRLVHARRRLLGRHDQVRRQDPPRGEDGRARHRPPGHRATSSGARRSEEEKAGALRDAGFDMSIDGDGFTSIQYQNANNSVRVTDEFMKAAERGEEWDLMARRVDPDGRAQVMKTLRRARPARPDRRGRVALRRPGRAVRHDDQRLAHVPELGPHQRVEPVLGVHARRRLGLQPRVDQPHEVPPPGRLVRRAKFEHASTSCCSRRRSSSAPSSYPTRRSATNARAFRQLGLGYANLGALLMSNGLPYDSDEGRAVAAAHHRAHDRPRLPPLGRDRRGDRARTTQLRGEPRAAQPRDAQAPRRGVQARRPAARAGARARGAQRHGTRPSRSARSTATATRRPRCSRPRARSRS